MRPGQSLGGCPYHSPQCARGDHTYTDVREGRRKQTSSGMGSATNEQRLPDKCSKAPIQLCYWEWVDICGSAGAAAALMSSRMSSHESKDQRGLGERAMNHLSPKAAQAEQAQNKRLRRRRVARAVCCLKQTGC